MTSPATFTYDDLRAIAGDAAASLPSDIVVRGVSTDSRTIAPSNIFIALRGERFDGHDHVVPALAAGAACCGVERTFYDAAPPEVQARCIPVDDTLHLLGSFGWYHRRRFDIPVIAIAGAAGKTSTKELTAHVLAQYFRVLKTQANYNNRVGTPHTLLQLTDEYDVAVIEIGTNEPGEIEVLSAMVQPTYGLITNIDKEHLEKLIDLDGVEREECALFEWLAYSGGLALINFDDERLQKYAVHNPRYISFALDTPAMIRPTIDFDAELHPIVHLVNNDFTLRARMKATGLAAARNAACALAVAHALRVPAELVKQGLESFEPAVGHGYARMAVEHVGDYVVLNDCYNANPASMNLALDTLRRFPAAMRVAVLGDMRELGLAEQVEHQAVLDKASQCADLVVVMGNAFREAAVMLDRPHVVVCETHAGCAHAVQQHAAKGAAVLVKGSRGLAMEHVIHELRTVH